MTIQSIQQDQINPLRHLQAREPWFHILFWICYLALPYLKSIGKNTHPYHITSELSDAFFGMIIFYTVYCIVLPSRNKLQNGFLTLILFCIVGYCNFKTHNLIFHGSHTEVFWYYAFSYISTYSILTLFAYVIYSIKEASKKQMKLNEVSQQKQYAEISALKAQINPHFLFNTLNAIYASALRKEDKAPGMIIKLSDTFRYVLQEGAREKVAIEKEIAHINDYISLQEERLREKVRVDFITHTDNPKKEIAPLLLISFIENAFKYSSLLKGSGHMILIRITLEEGQLTFYCENPIKGNSSQNMDGDWEESGIGIANTKRRLALLYPGKHQLDIIKTNVDFKVNLTIVL